jgi:hypothetical protein
MIPQHLRPLFWDIDTEKFDPAAFPQYTIARVLEFGDEKAVAWLREIFPEAAIKEIIRKERRLTRRSANFWALVYNIPRDQVAALVAPREDGLWPH